jgi:hypothetical protein
MGFEPKLALRDSTALADILVKLRKMTHRTVKQKV